MRSRSTLLETTTTRAPSVLAPELSRVADALLAFAHDPSDRRAKIALALLTKQGALDCPSCGARFHVSGYRATHTAFLARRCLDCVSCRTSFVVEEAHFA
jgi:hypothetical protein